ncbi:MAG TPA: energy transducer TonB [Puia sp.]|nr:energy transducer TonB [Puia sp.]
MNTESILAANVLDIIFENRNKEYGAYELRTRYEQRLKNAMAIMISMVILFCTVIYIGGHYFHHPSSAAWKPDEVIPTIITIKKNETTFGPIKPKTTQLTRRMPTVPFVTPKIVQASQPAKPFPTPGDLDTSQIGPETIPGEAAGGPVTVDAGTDKGNTVETKTETTASTVVDLADTMPEFPGGEAALQRFLAKNMRMPKDLEPGTIIRVMEKFVVDQNGNISAARTIQSGGLEFDNEVLRVLKKMPKWKPGRQNGKNVAVYFNLPVIFLSRDDN